MNSLRSTAGRALVFSWLCLPVVIAWLAPSMAGAQSTDDASFAMPSPFKEQTGPALYQHICQGCHMSDGSGAAGAGKYPPLANSQRLAASGYVIAMVLGGRGAMPGFARYLDDMQVAAVAGYVRTNFGNDYREPVKRTDVARIRLHFKR